MTNMSSNNVKPSFEPINKNLVLDSTTPEENHSNYASACSSPVPNRFSTAEEPSNISDMIPSIIAKAVVARETIDYRDMGVEITSFAHPAKTNEFDQTVQYSQSDLTILSNSTVTELPSIIIDKGDVTHFVANVVEDEQVNYTVLRQLLQNQEKKSSSSNDTSNILGNLAESSILMENISQETVTEKEKMSNETKEIENIEGVEENREKKIEKTGQQLDLILQELDRIREENEKLKINSDNLCKEIRLLQEENEHLKIGSDNYLQELNQLREENKNLKIESNEELEKLREENKRLEMKSDSPNDSKSHEFEFMREENERLKLELHAYKRNTRPLSKSPSKDTKESKTTETRRNIFKDKLYFKLQLNKVDELEAETLANLVKVREILLLYKPYNLRNF
ncbi:hypothetical protein C1645_752598 [Glomus cerebriforme]|uniref:Uncharacterized protein n=1 Tax=Glomus cerebriforme TaxID=658196 RepID=A0A397TIY2_9GLOM|nr:hypothetical protein C1645_752598 [Glomus cerebriforme]